MNWIHKFGDISLLIGEKDYWGKGIAYESIKLLTKFAFNSLNIHKLKAGCYADNIGSAKAFEKVGFEREGIFKKQWMVNGKYQDEIILSLCYEDWVNKK
ncbi:MAG: GNAT family protein [Ignavibacteriae bacterium]|nr:GNAT family protein [Ignavibacteriota bacterium]